MKPRRKPKPISFNNPVIIGRELEYIADAVAGGHLAGNGRYTRRCEDWFEKHYGARRVLLTHSCTAALEMAAILTDLQPGDEVIMPPYAFVSTANAFYIRGAYPRFVDIRPDTLNLDETQIESAINARTRAIVPLHYAGVGCEMDTILRTARKHRLFVIEDAAQGVDATYKGRPLGTMGHLGAFSFHETKNIICGEGGALIINQKQFIERAEIILEKGTNRRKFFRGDVDKYTWVDIGSSYLPSDMVAAFLYAQLENMDRIHRRRRGIFDYYAKRLQPLAKRGLIRTPFAPRECRHNGHMFYILVQTGPLDRDRLLRHFRKSGILAVFHYVPLHTSPVGRNLGYKPGDFPVTESISSQIIRLPNYHELTVRDQDRVISTLADFFGVSLK